MKISVIIPVYNIGKYIERCLESIDNQTYSNIEAIIVDDGSTDNSSELIDKYLDNKKFIIIHKKNGGLSSARNEGLKAATGDFVMFVDGDDYLFNDAIEILVKKIADDVDVILFPYIKVYSNKKVKIHLFSEEEIKFSNKEVKDIIFPYLIGPSKKNNNLSPMAMDRLNTAWGKLYRKSLINNIMFVDTNEIGTEDGWYNILVFSKIKGSCLYTEETWYLYEKGNTTSLLHSYKENYCEKRWNFYRLVDRLLKNKDLLNLKYNLYNRIVIELFGITVNEASKKSSLLDTSKNMKLVLDKYDYKKVFYLVDKKCFSLIWRIFFRLCEKKEFGLLILLIRCTKIW